MIFEKQELKAVQVQVWPEGLGISRRSTRTRPRAALTPAAREGKLPGSSSDLFLQPLKTMRPEMQIYDFLKSYLWIPKMIMFPSLT